MSKWPKEWWKQITPKRGEIYWVNFGKLEEKDASQGTEINGKTRPAVVISNNLQNEKGRRVIILPMSTTIDKYPYRFDLYVGKIINNYQESKVTCEQVRSIDKRRLQNYAGKLSGQQINDIFPPSKHPQILPLMLPFPCIFRVYTILLTLVSYLTLNPNIHVFCNKHFLSGPLFHDIYSFARKLLKINLKRKFGRYHGLPCRPYRCGRNR